MPRANARTSCVRFVMTMLLGGAALALAPAALAACRVTDFTDRTLSSLSEAQRLSFVRQMTPTEFVRLRAVQPGDPNYYKLIAESPTVGEARQAARDKLSNLRVENIDDYPEIWATDFLTDEQIRKFLDCVSSRQPGLTVAGRSAAPDQFNLSFTHITPVGIRKITTRVIASDNIANIEDFKKYLADLGPQDNYTARTFQLKLKDPKERAVVVMRAGWETPKFVYIPVYPSPQYFSVADEPGSQRNTGGIL